MSKLPYICPEHPYAEIVHTYDVEKCVWNGMPSGTGIEKNHRYFCNICKRELSLGADNAER